MGNCPNNILNARQASGLSQKAVAISLGVSSPTVSDWERERKYPSIDNLKQLADLFSVSVDYLLGRTDQKSNAPTSDIPGFSSISSSDLFLEIAHQHGEKNAAAFSMYLSLDSEDRGEIRGQMKQMLKSGKYSDSPFPAASDESAV